MKKKLLAIFFINKRIWNETSFSTFLCHTFLYLYESIMLSQVVHMLTYIYMEKNKYLYSLASLTGISMSWIFMVIIIMK